VTVALQRVLQFRQRFSRVLEPEQLLPLHCLKIFTATSALPTPRWQHR
jgi:hypothetical protein